MGNVILAAAIAAALAFVIISQVKGQSLHGKQMALLPAILMVFGLVNLAGMSGVGPADIACITGSAVIAAAIGLGQGAVMRLEGRDGTLWGQLPRRGLWLWAALILSRVAVVVVAHALGAGAAASLDSIIVVLGINRLAQAAVVAARAVRAGLPIAL
jgi:hypothetical protein